MHKNLIVENEQGAYFLYIEVLLKKMPGESRSGTSWQLLTLVSQDGFSLFGFK
jgi:hypothetical protein